MTINEFRSNPALTLRMREIMADPVFRAAREALRDGNPPIDADPKDDPIVSARILSQMVGYNTYAAALEALSNPLLQKVDLERNYQPEE